MTRRRCFRAVARDRGWRDTPACHARAMRTASLVCVLALVAQQRDAARCAATGSTRRVARAHRCGREGGREGPRPSPQEEDPERGRRSRGAAQAPARGSERGQDRRARPPRAGIELQRWGLVPLGYDYTARLVDLLADQIAGYYDSKTKKLTILDTAGSDPAWAEMVLAHELDHGLQDQAFDLDKFEKLPDDDTRRADRAPRARRGRRRRADDRGDARARGHHEPVVGAGGRRSGDPGDGGARSGDEGLARHVAARDHARRCCSRIATASRSSPRCAARSRGPRSTPRFAGRRDRPSRSCTSTSTSPTTSRSRSRSRARRSPGYTVLTSDVWGELGMRSFLLTHGVSPTRRRERARQGGAAIA